MTTLIPPPLEDHNAWADFWYYQIGVNVVPADTKNKVTYCKWSQWQTQPVPEDLYTQWRQEGKFQQGLGIIVGKVWRGEQAGKYLIFVDCDNQKAITEFCTRDGTTFSLSDTAQKFLVEQHEDNPNKAHVYFFSEVAFTKKSSDVTPQTKEGIDADQLPAFEIKGNSVHGMAFCTPSVHKSGKRYQIIGTFTPVTLNSRQAHELMQHLDSICKRHGLRYLDLDNGNGNAQVPITELFKEDFVIHENHNRHGAILRAMESLIKRNAGILTLEEIKELAQKWNQNHCSPALDDREFEKQWRDATKYITKKMEQEEEQPTQTQPQEPTIIELTDDLTKEVTFDYIADTCLSTSIKRDKAPKLITFNGMLLAQTNDDQFNVGFQAESSAGKSYIPLEVASYFPKKEVEIIASASPTAFYHDGQWDPERKVLVRDLRHKILIFLDQPHFQLLERLRPLLSHDDPELHYKITDKNQKHGLRTKNVIIIGPASFFFCTAKTNHDEQEKTRMFMMSPETDEGKFKETLQLIALKKGDSDEYRKQVLEDSNRLWLQKRISSIR